MRDVGVVRGMTTACLRHPVVNSKEAAYVFQKNEGKLQGHCSFTLSALEPPFHVSHRARSLRHVCRMHGAGLVMDAWDMRRCAMADTYAPLIGRGGRSMTLLAANLMSRILTGSSEA